MGNHGAGKFKVTRSGWMLLGVVAGVLGIGATSGAIGSASPEPWPLWEAYTARFMDAQGRVIDHSIDDKTTSEGQSYAMFFALVDNDRARFDKVLQWTEANLAGGDLAAHLPAWCWGKSPEGEWKVLDGNSASDSDLWIAYSLLEAGRLWHEPKYEKLGTALASRIAQEEVVLVPGLGATLIAGNKGFHPDANTWIVNPGYLPLPILARLAMAQPHGPWKAVSASLKPLLANGSGAGYAMDWVAAGNGTHPTAAPGTKDAAAIGSYDAIRVYLWLGITDAATPGRAALLGSLDGMGSYLKGQGVPPEKVDSTGKILAATGPVGFSAALVPFLEARGLKDEAKVQADRVAGMKDAASGLYGGDTNTARYYDQNLILFSNGWVEERYRFEKDGQLLLKWK